MDPYAFPALGHIMEPCGASGNIIRAAKPFIPRMNWHAVEKREECGEQLRKEHANLVIGDFLDKDWWPVQKIDTIITNPPYSDAEDFIRKSVKIANHTFMLLRLNFLSSSKRVDLFNRFMPDVYVLPNRPSFTGEGTDSTDYGWFHWTKGRIVPEGKIQVLSDTPASERRGG